MNKFVFVALMTSFGMMAVARLAPGETRKPSSPAHAVGKPVVSWTCTHNTYRSVLCP
jgi:hypothetical protein